MKNTKRNVVVCENRKCKKEFKVSNELTSSRYCDECRKEIANKALRGSYGH